MYIRHFAALFADYSADDLITNHDIEQSSKLVVDDSGDGPSTTITNVSDDNDDNGDGVCFRGNAASQRSST